MNEYTCPDKQAMLRQMNSQPLPRKVLSVLLSLAAVALVFIALFFVPYFFLAIIIAVAMFCFGWYCRGTCLDFKELSRQDEIEALEEQCSLLDQQKAAAYDNGWRAGCSTRTKALEKMGAVQDLNGGN